MKPLMWVAPSCWAVAIFDGKGGVLCYIAHNDGLTYVPDCTVTFASVEEAEGHAVAFAARYPSAIGELHVVGLVQGKEIPRVADVAISAAMMMAQDIFESNQLRLKADPLDGSVKA